MSENIQTVESKTMTTIPTQKEDITIKWIHMIINQNLLKSGKAPLDQEAIEGMNFEIIDCKSRYFSRPVPIRSGGPVIDNSLYTQVPNADVLSGL